MPTCTYCGEPQNALKNHVRLSSGNGHGPSGQYPEDFDREPATDDVGSSSSQTTQDGDGGGSVDEDLLQFTQEEYDELVEEIRTEAYDEGFEDGLSSSKNQPNSGGDTSNGDMEPLRCGCDSFDRDEYDLPVILECDECGDVAEYYVG